MNETLLEPLAFEKAQLPQLRKKARRLALLASAHGKNVDAEEVAAAALPILYARYRRGLARFRGTPTIKEARHAMRLAQAVRVAAMGGDVGTGVPLESDLAFRRLGYRPLKRAESYAAYYKLPPCGRESDGISQADLADARSRFARLGLDWRWIELRDRGLSHVETARACGRDGTDKALDAFSRRRAALCRRIVREVAA